MKRYILLFSMAYFLCINLCAEILNTEAYSNCTNISYRGKEYAPLFIPNENDPIMYVRLNLIFIQKDDGTGNFQENNTEHQSLLNTAMTILNDNIIASLQMPGTDCFSGSESDMIHDMRIRFIDHRYYIPKSAVWDNNLYNSATNMCPGYSWFLAGIDDSINNAIPDTLKGINVYFTEDATLYHRCWEVQNLNDTTPLGNNNTQSGCSMFPSYSNLQESSQIHMPCLYSKYWWMQNIAPQLVSEHNPSWIPTGRLLMAGSIASSLAHELGHSFYLYHPIDDSNVATFYPSPTCVNTIMNPAGNSPRNFLPPQEIGRMYVSAMTTNVQQFIPSNTYLGTKTLNSTVSLPRMRMYYSLEVGHSGNVTMPCDMTFSPQSNITIQNGGVLSINGASLHSIQDSWGGITIQSGGKLVLSDVAIGDYDIVVKSGGSLIINSDLTITGDHSITVEDGGYLCINSTASVNLADEFSIIAIYPNAILGCPSCNVNCITTRNGLIHSGNGRYVTYEGTDFVQNLTISSDYLATGNSVYGGYDVTTTKPVGEVVVNNGGNLKIKANESILTKNVEVKLGGTLLISK